MTNLTDIFLELIKDSLGSEYDTFLTIAGYKNENELKDDLMNEIIKMILNWKLKAQF